MNDHDAAAGQAAREGGDNAFRLAMELAMELSGHREDDPDDDDRVRRAELLAALAIELGMGPPDLLHHLLGWPREPNASPSMRTWQLDVFTTWDVLGAIIRAARLDINWDDVERAAIQRLVAQSGDASYDPGEGAFVGQTIRGIREASERRYDQRPF